MKELTLNLRDDLEDEDNTLSKEQQRRRKEAITKWVNEYVRLPLGRQEWLMNYLKKVWKKPLFTNLTPVLTKAESCLLDGHRLEAREPDMGDMDGTVVVCLDCKRIIGIETHIRKVDG